MLRIIENAALQGLFANLPPDFPPVAARRAVGPKDHFCATAKILGAALRKLEASKIRRSDKWLQ